MADLTVTERKILALFARIGPGHPPTRYEADLHLTRPELHDAVSALKRRGLLDTDMEFGSTWMGDIK